MFWETADSESFFPLAVWPSAQASVSRLNEAAARAAAERRGLILERSSEVDTGGPERTRFEVAFPVEVAGHLHGVVALDVAPCPGPQLQAALRQLQWGFAWLEVMVRGEQARKKGEPDLKVDWQSAFSGFGAPPPAPVGMAAKRHPNFAEF